MLAGSEGAAIDYLDAHRNTLRSLFSGDEYAAFEKTVNRFDFGVALDVLRRAAEERGITLEEGSR